MTNYKGKTETQRTVLLCEELTTFNCVCTVLAGGNRFQSDGLPDRHFAHTRLQGGIFVEFKNPKTVLKENQRLIAKAWCERGTPAIIARFMDYNVIKFQNHRLELLGKCKIEPLAFLKGLQMILQDGVWRD